VASQRGIVAKDGIFGYLLMVLRALEEFPEMRLELVPGDAAIGEGLRERLLAGSGVMLGVEFFEVFLPHGAGIAAGVAAGRFFLAGLRGIGDGRFGDFEVAFEPWKR